MNIETPTARRGWYGAFDLTQRSTFSYFTEEGLRFADVDRNGHINNVAFTEFFENTRVRYLTEVVPLERTDSVGFVVAHLSIDYLAQLYYPGRVTSGIRLVEVRRSSLVLGQAVFHDEVAMATGHTIIVTVNRQTGRGAPLPDATRAMVTEMLKQ